MWNRLLTLKIAISTLLQPPIVRTGLLPQTTGQLALRGPSIRDIPPVTLTTIPRIDNAVFKSYITQAGPLYESFRRAKDGPEDNRRLNRRGSKADSAGGEALGYGSRRHSASSISPKFEAGGTLPSPLDAPPTPQTRRSGRSGKRSGQTVAPLSTIPSVYFEPDFRLENPRTFDVVSERSEIARPIGANGVVLAPGSSGKKALAANAILQEKLSWYMDTVEVHLISSISTASTSFFAALGSLRTLHAEAAQSVEKIKTLRGDLEKLDQNMAVGGLKILAMKRRLENMQKLGDAVRQLEGIVKAVSRCEDQVETGDIDEALRGLTEVERLIAGDAEDLPPVAQSKRHLQYQGNLIDLRGLKALEGAGSDIAFLRKRIGKGFEVKFIETLLDDLRKHVDKVPTGSTFQRWEFTSSRRRGHQTKTPAEFPAYLSIDQEFRSILHGLLKGLARSDYIMQAAVTYREVILKEFKKLIRRHMPSSSDDDVESTTSIATHTSGHHLSRQEKSSILSRNLRNLEPEDAEEMFKKVYSNLGEALRRLGTQVKVLLDITSSLGNPHPNPLKSPPRTPHTGALSPPMALDRFMHAEPSPGPPPALVRQEEIQQALDLSSLLGQAVDIAQAEVTKVLKVRVEQTTRLPMPFFLKYFTLNRLFTDECEAISGRGGASLRNVVHEHIKSFVKYTSEREKEQLINKMDADKWEAKDFTDEDSQRLNRILSASTSDVDDWTKASALWLERPVENGATKNGQPTNGVSPGSLAAAQTDVPKEATKDKVRSAIIDEEKYILPDSAMVVAGGIEVFERLIAGIPTMSVDITSSMFEYIKLFNSRSSQLILGAGATRSAGLKNITTRHLALSSQALSFVVAIIPYIREFDRRYIPSSSTTLADFDKIKRLLQEHQSGIHDKLIEIMTGRATSHVNAMRKVDFDDGEESGVNTYMETLVRETSTLHKVLARHLPEPSVQMIMGPVIVNYREQWGRAFKTVNCRTQGGKDK